MEAQLINYLPENWEIDLRAGSLKLIAPRKTEIYPFLSNWLHEVRKTAFYLGVVEIGSKDSKQVTPVKPLRRSAAFEQFSSIAPSIHVLSPLPASLELLRALGTIAENPEQRWFLHRVSPDFNRMVQIALSEASRSLIVGATPQQAVGRNRSDYMTPGELSRMQQKFRQEFSEGGRCEFGFVLFSPETKADWRHVQYDYTHVGTLPDGDLLQLGLCQDVRPIASPVR